MMSQMGNSLSQMLCAAGASRFSTAASKNFMAMLGRKFVQTGAHPVAPAMKACRLVDSHPAISVI